MRHGSLFSGIGGFDLAAEWMGWENIFHCEWNKFGQQVLKYYWPKSISYEDITKTDFTIHRGSIDILTGGFPCQPYSSAGKRLGKEDERHLWPEMLRAIREIQPSWVVGENVRGLTNWNGGMVFDEVQAELEAQGYEVLPFLLPACAVNAPHRRDRIWFVAHSKSKYNRRKCGWMAEKNGQANRGWIDNYKSKSSHFSDEESVANTSSIGLQCERESAKLGWNRFSFYNAQSNKSNWVNFPSVSPICAGDDGLSDRLDSITFPKWRTESIKAGGNAIVPQVVHQIFKAIEEYERITTANTD
jgi:DNA (cytosine-5)-methyltransferase 1